MMEIEIVRTTVDKAKPQCGVMLFDGVQKLVTLELPDLNNQPDISCIPIGYYICKRGKMYIGHDEFRHLISTFLIQDIPDRKEVGIHPANYVRELKGCVAVGYIIDFDEKGGIGDSGRAFMRFMDLTIDVDEFGLTIRKA